MTTDFLSEECIFSTLLVNFRWWPHGSNLDFAHQQWTQWRSGFRKTEIIRILALIFDLLPFEVLRKRNIFAEMREKKKAKEQKVQRNTEIFLKVSSKFHFKYLTKSLHGLYYEQSVTELWSFDSCTDQDRYCFSKVCAGLVLTCCVLGLETTLISAFNCSGL